MGEISYVDEYDKPLLNNISNKPLQGNSTLCGATEQENHEQLDDFVQQMADSNHISKDDCYKELKKWYEGYHLHPNSVDVYNPFGLMRALYSKEFKEYWFESGTPTFLVEIIKKHSMKLTDLDDVKRTSAQLAKIDNFNDDPVPLLFQSGYLTIKSYDSILKRYTLTMPNKKVGIKNETVYKDSLTFDFCMFAEIFLQFIQQLLCIIIVLICRFLIPINRLFVVFFNAFSFVITIT